MLLSIDTSNFNHFQIALLKNGTVLAQKTSESEKRLSQKLLPQIQQLLKENKFKFDDLTGIQVSLGPGSFTSLRIGIAIANALSFALGIPVNNLPQGELATPRYGHEPNITHKEI